MAFPTSPTNGQITTVNGIRYSYSSISNSWTRISSGKFTAAATGPSNPATGDHWYNTTEDTLYEYVSDGVSSYWLDIQSGFVGGNAGSVISDTTIAGNLIPSANLTYSLGTSTKRFKDLFLSGNTIDLGGATIKTDATSGAIALIPQPTVANPNPTGIVVSPAGTVSTVSTSGGTLSTNAISNASNTAVTTNTTTFGNITSNGNVITANVYADRFFYSNGTAFSSSSFGNTEVAAYLANSNINTSGNISAGNISITSNVSTSSIKNSGSIYNNSGRIILGQTGSIIQTQYVSSGTRTTVDSTSFVEPSVNYRVNITPTSTSSLIKVFFYIPMNAGASYQSNTIYSIRAFRLVNSVKTYSLTSAGVSNGSRNPIAGVTFRPNNGFDLNDPCTQHFFVFDAPATTSQVTYGFEFKRETGGTGVMYFGYTAGDSALWGFDTNITILVQEIAQ